MSKHYEFLSDDAYLVPFEDLADEGLAEDGPGLADPELSDQVALVMGYPWDAAGVLMGTREDIAGTLRRWLAVVEAA